MNDQILVSVLCVMYNHEKFARKTLDSLIMQKTSFKYEIIVHDDASTDNTKKIIREYAEKYPDIIKTILQEENQQSKGINIYRNYIYPKASGKYIALCEGDDYWTDEHKLQVQADFLENNLDYIACVHNEDVLIRGKIRKKKYCDINHEMDLGLAEVISSGGAYYQTSSLMFRFDLIKNAAGELPSFFKTTFPLYDYPFGIYMSQYGKIKYMPECMGVYRYIAEGSWTEKTNEPRKRLEHIKIIKKMLKEVNEWLGEGIHPEVNAALSVYKRDEYLLSWKLNIKREILYNRTTLSYIKELGKKNGLLVALPIHYPLLYKLYKRYSRIKNKGNTEFII